MEYIEEKIVNKIIIILSILFLILLFDTLALLPLPGFEKMFSFYPVIYNELKIEHAMMCPFIAIFAGVLVRLKMCQTFNLSKNSEKR